MLFRSIASDESDELERIAEWCKQRVEQNPEARILIALPGAPGTRERLATLIRQAVNPGEWFGARANGNASIDEAPLDVLKPAQSRSARSAGASRQPETSRLSGASQPTDAAQAEGTASDATTHRPTDNLVVIEGGIPLSRVPAVAHALATLSWLGGNTGDFEAVSGWLRAPYWQAPGALQRARLDLWLRERERMHFDLHELVVALSGAHGALASTAREVSDQIKKAAVALGQGSASPRDWSERFKAALEKFDWPGERARGSGEQQTVVRF